MLSGDPGHRRSGEPCLHIEVGPGRAATEYCHVTTRSISPAGPNPDAQAPRRLVTQSPPTARTRMPAPGSGDHDDANHLETRADPFHIANSHHMLVVCLSYAGTPFSYLWSICHIRVLVTLAAGPARGIRVIVSRLVIIKLEKDIPGISAISCIPISTKPQNDMPTLKKIS